MSAGGGVSEGDHRQGTTAAAAEQAAVVIRRLDQPGDLGWVAMAHGELYAEEFGWDGSFEALVSRIVADYAGNRDPDREAAWIAEVDGRRAGCVFCVSDDETTARLRALLVHPDARGRGLGERLVATCLDFARAAGYRRITLWTNDVLVSARTIYIAAGFELVDQERRHRFGHDLVGQNWARRL
jgi:GNAT superfamily N-acetyltransferase